MGKLVGTCVELGIAEFDLAVHDGDGLRRTLDLPFDFMVQVRALGKGDLAAIAVIQSAAFLGAQQWQLA